MTKKLLPVLTLLFLLMVKIAYADNTYSADFESDNTQYLSITNGAQTNMEPTGDWTISFWYKPESFSANHTFYSTISSDSLDGFRVYRTTNYGLKVQVRNNGTTDDFQEWGETLNNGTWYFIKVNYSASAKSVDLFINNEWQGTKTGGTNAGASQGGEGAVLGGASPMTPTAWNTDGLIDDFRLYTASTTGETYDEELNGNETDLNAYYKFNNDFTDETANSNDLTNNNSVSFSEDMPFLDEGGEETDTSTTATTTAIDIDSVFSLVDLLLIISFGIIGTWVFFRAAEGKWI